MSYELYESWQSYTKHVWRIIYILFFIFGLCKSWKRWRQERMQLSFNVLIEQPAKANSIAPIIEHWRWVKFRDKIVYVDDDETEVL